jgi:hypothetical protein
MILCAVQGTGLYSIPETLEHLHCPVGLVTRDDCAVEVQGQFSERKEGFPQVLIWAKRNNDSAGEDQTGRKWTVLDRAVEYSLVALCDSKIWA